MDHQQLIAKYHILKQKSGNKKAFNTLAKELNIDISKNACIKQQEQSEQKSESNENNKTSIEIKQVDINNDKNAYITGQQLQTPINANVCMPKQLEQNLQLNESDISNTKENIQTIFTFILNESSEKEQIKGLICKFNDIFENMDTLLIDNNSGDTIEIIKNEFNTYKISEIINIDDINN